MTQAWRGRGAARSSACLAALVVAAAAHATCAATTKDASGTGSGAPRRWGAQALRGIPPLRALLAAPLRGGAVGVISNEKKTEGVRCRLKKGGTTFEVLCHTAKVELFREGAAAQAEVLVAPDLFKDIKTGDRPSADEVEKAFGHADLDKAVEEVLLKGELQLSTAERRKKTDEKLEAIKNFIATNYMEPKTNLPIPRTRIENGIETLKGLKVDAFRSTATQAEEACRLHAARARARRARRARYACVRDSPAAQRHICLLVCR